MKTAPRRIVYLAVAIVPCVVAYTFSIAPRPDGNLMAVLFSRYDWERHDLPEPPIKRHAARLIMGENVEDAATKTMRHRTYVRSNLAQVEAWISAVGAAITAADLDMDGVCDDLLHTDPRFGEITVAKAPFVQSPTNFSSFVLRPENLELSLAYGPPDAPQVAGVLPMGTLVADYNGDGAMDIIAYYWGRSPLVFLRKKDVPLSNHAFEAVELLPEPEIWHTNAAIQGDFNGDGVLDLVFGNFFADHAPVLEAEDTEKAMAANFKRARLPAGIEESKEARTPQMQASKAKATNGGDLKFLKGNAREGGESTGTFTPLPSRGPESILRREIEGQWVLALGAADLDSDGKLDIYVANDFGPDLLLSNRTLKGGSLMFTACYGSRKFTSPKSCVIGKDSFKGMGVCIADINGDQRLDIQAGNIGDEFALQESHFAWLRTDDMEAMQQGRAPFIHGAEKLHIARLGWEWDTKCGDFDNDGQPEILQACGFIFGEKLSGWASLHSVALMNALALNSAGHWAPMKQGIDISGHNLNGFLVPWQDARGELHYHDLNRSLVDEKSLRAPFPDPMVTRGIALADMDDDGWLDFVVANQWKPSFAYRNTAGAKRDGGGALSLTIMVVDDLHASSPWTSGGNARPAFGATVKIQPLNGRGQPQTAVIDPGNGHAGRSAPEVHFGLGKNPATEWTATVAWGLTSHGQPRVFQTKLDAKAGRVALVLENKDGGNARAVIIPRKNP